MRDYIEEADALLEQNRAREAEALLLEGLQKAKEQGRLGDQAALLNELVGYYRQTEQYEKAYDCGRMALEALRKEGGSPENAVSVGTTLLNLATAYRAGGRYEEALELYRQARAVYEAQLEKGHMLYSGLYNNLSLLYQEMGEYEKAAESQRMALEVVEKNSPRGYEHGVILTNLASSCLQLGLGDEAAGYLREAIGIFEEREVRDSHYCAALSALGTYHYQRGEYALGEELFGKAARGIEAQLGQNQAYRQLMENVRVCREAAAAQRTGAGGQALSPREELRGMELCRRYYEAWGRPMIHRLFPAYEDRIAVGLAGEGSDCYGYDDALSRDHDWGPGFCMWVTEEVYGQIGEALQQAYEELPKSFEGFTFQASPQAGRRRGVRKIREFYTSLLGEENCPAGERWEAGQVKWSQIPDAALSAAVNGQVFRDGEGCFTAIRSLLQEGCPERIWFLKIAQAAARFSQAAQYNYERLLKRGDSMGARLMLSDGVREALKLAYYGEGVYPPHDKWLAQGLRLRGGYEPLLEALERALLEDGRGEDTSGRDLAARAERTGKAMEAAAGILSARFYQTGQISDIDPYLEGHVEELLFKASLTELSVEELSERIARKEFEAFDKVKNEGGRADCQDDWFTFSIMRKSQYLTWDETMLRQYYYDFCREYERGHNLIEEKYGRMMESTAPEEYEKIKDNFPAVSQEKRGIVEKIAGLQVAWMEDFARRYPMLAGNARRIHTWEDDAGNTSYETYLRGELLTYSDKMLELYGRYIVAHAQGPHARNLAEEIMEHSVLMYGYESLQEAEEGLAREAK